MLIQTNEYDLVADADAHLEAITALARRVETDGHPGVQSYWFFVNRAANTAGAVIAYEDADAWVAHHEMAYQWDEMGTLQATVSLTGLTLFGPINDRIREMGSGLTYTHYDGYAAGFAR